MADIRRSWNDKEHTRIRCYQHVEGRHAIPDIIKDLESRGVDWRQVELNYTATWTDDPTPDEIKAQAEREARAAERQEAWEREALIRLTAKYGAPSAQVVAALVREA